MTQLSLGESKAMLFRYEIILFPSGIKFESCQMEGWRGGVGEGRRTNFNVQIMINLKPAAFSIAPAAG